MQSLPRPQIFLRRLVTVFILCLATNLPFGLALEAQNEDEPPVKKPKASVPEAGPDLDLASASVTYHQDLDLLVFRVEVVGTAGGTTPVARGELDGAPVLGYVFPTDLKPLDVGFRIDDGIVALAVTSHPDFDDTPLWDENSNGDWNDDGVVFHTHWVVLESDARVAGGLAVRQIAKTEIANVLPPTNPGMPMAMDSPGYSVVLHGRTLKVLVPAQRIKGRTSFQFDAVTAYMEVATTGDRPLLGVHRVYDVLSGDLSMPYRVQNRRAKASQQ